MDQNLEQWRPVVGYEGLYEVSDHGRVRSLPRTCLTKGNATRTVSARVMSQNRDGRGYLAVILSKDGKKTTTRVYLIVAKAFIGERPDGMVVAHGPAGKDDNSVANVSYKTQSENCAADKLRDDTHTRGGRNYNARLTEEQVLFARKAVARRQVSIGHLADAWNVNRSTLGKAINGRNWSWL